MQNLKNNAPLTSGHDIKKGVVLLKEYMKTIINALKFWIKHDAFTAEDALNIITDIGAIEPLMAADGTIYTSPEGDIYTL